MNYDNIAIDQLVKNADEANKRIAEGIPRPYVSPQGLPYIVGRSEKIEFVPPPVSISPERLLQMQQYAMKLHNKYPKWKLHKIQRKTAEYFKVIITNEKVSPANPEGKDS